MSRRVGLLTRSHDTAATLSLGLSRLGWLPVACVTAEEAVLAAESGLRVLLFGPGYTAADAAALSAGLPSDLHTVRLVDHLEAPDREAKLAFRWDDEIVLPARLKVLRHIMAGLEDTVD